MINNSNSSLSNLLILATLSSSVVSINNELEYYQLSEKDISFQKIVNIADWKDYAFNESYDYNIYFGDQQKINIMISFTKNLLEHSKEIDNEFVDIVNDNFWDLI